MLIAALTDAFPSRYSQGAGLLHNSIPNLAQGVKQRIAAIVVFGDTYHVKDKGQIPGYPQNRFLAFCNTGDLVCHDASAKNPVIMPAHLTYPSEVPKAVNFYRQRIDSFGSA